MQRSKLEFMQVNIFWEKGQGAFITINGISLSLP